jgi:hypothetical protein
MLINIPNNDSKIIGRDEIIIKLVTAMIACVPRLDISLNGEGPCAKSLGLYTLLDKLTAEFDYNKKNIFINTCNLIEHHNEYNIVIVPQTMYLESARNYSTQVNSTKFFDNIKTFGNFIGHGNHLRLFLASYLYTHYQNISLQTYHCNVKDSYHYEFIGLDDILHYDYTWDAFDNASLLLKNAPLTQDDIDAYPILNPTTLNITKLYPNFFVEIANLTYFSGDTFYIDEKIWRPIIMRTPFIVQGPQNFINNFKKLGFKTFSNWWNEGYSEDPPHYQLTGITAVIDQLSKKSTSELQSMYNDMQPVLEHNLQLLKEIKKQDFL